MLKSFVISLTVSVPGETNPTEILLVLTYPSLRPSPVKLGAFVNPF